MRSEPNNGHGVPDSLILNMPTLGDNQAELTCVDGTLYTKDDANAIRNHRSTCTVACLRIANDDDVRDCLVVDDQLRDLRSGRCRISGRITAWYWTTGAGGLVLVDFMGV